MDVAASEEVLGKDSADEDSSWRQPTSEAGGLQHSKQLSLSYAGRLDDSTVSTACNDTCPTWTDILLNAHK